MQTCIGYIKQIVKYKKKTKTTYTPIYENLGVGKVREKPASKEIKRET